MEQIFTLLFYIFIGVTFINVTFYVFYWLFAFAKISNTKTSPLPPVSVIICAKNESANLQKNIPKILSQDYPEFEVILINDASSDDTEDIMEAFKLANVNVQQVNVVNNETFWGNKKYALTLGIKRAQHKHMLFTDADCVPASDQWLQHMASTFNEDKEIVLGYGAYEKIKGSWVNKLIRFETLMTALQYFSWAKAGRPYMGVGRNLAYTSDVFYEQKGFINHIKIQSGDDDLFVNEASTRKNTAIQFSPESFTISTPKKTFASWITQKRRHISTAVHYKFLEKSLLALFYISQCLFLVGAVALLVTQFNWEWVALIIGVRYVCAWITVGCSAARLQEKDLTYLYPIYEIALVCVQMSIFICNLITKPTRWK